MGLVESADVGANEAIRISVQENRVVRISDPSGSQAIALDELADSSVTNGIEREFWGTCPEGGEWCVHVVGGPGEREDTWYVEVECDVWNRVTDGAEGIDDYTYRVVAPGCETWDQLPGHGTLQARIEHTLFLIHGRYPMRVREVAPGRWRGRIGRRATETLEVRGGK